MNFRHPYEKHLAEKLVQLPPPGDSDQNWPQMKALLDKNMPRGGGGSGGSYRWWITGTVIVAVLVGTWFGGKQLLLTSEQRNATVAGKIKTVNNKTAPNVASNEKKSGEPVAPPIAQNNEGATPSGASADPRGATYASVTEPKSSTGSAGNSQNQPVENNTVTAGKNNAATKNDQLVAKNNNSANRALNNEPVEQAEQARSSGNNKSEAPLVAAGNKTATSENTTSFNNKTSINRKNIYSPNKNSTNLPPLSSPNRHTPGAGLLKESPVVIMVDYTGTSAIAPSGVLQREFTYYTQSSLFPDMAARNKRSSRKSSRSSQGYADRRFAIGLSLPLTFPVGDQQPLAYNRQAVENTISDYIPSPHFQYHFNSKTFVQTGVQFSAPQFINPVLLYENERVDLQANMYELTSIYARKLYYFNLPVSVYHSPLKNFYMGTGLQFSSLLSGVAHNETIRRPIAGPPQQYVSQNYFRFRNDSLSRRLNSNEIRLLLDINYYWSRFSVGLQYNQAFNNFISYQVTPNSPYTFDKNKSLQFYLRYNIWEDKKRKQPKNQLTLK